MIGSPAGMALFCARGGSWRRADHPSFRVCLRHQVDLHRLAATASCPPSPPPDDRRARDRADHGPDHDRDDQRGPSRREDPMDLHLLGVEADRPPRLPSREPRPR
jgi:hypothetical protein